MLTNTASNDNEDEDVDKDIYYSRQQQQKISLKNKMQTLLIMSRVIATLTVYDYRRSVNHA